jgi:hypothetical protein
VNQAAKNFIHNNDFSIVLIGDKNILMDKLNSLGIEILEVDMKGNLIG